jgi:uncharacterized protein (TIGR03437 family)
VKANLLAAALIIVPSLFGAGNVIVSVTGTAAGQANLVNNAVSQGWILPAGSTYYNVQISANVVGSGTAYLTTNIGNVVTQAANEIAHTTFNSPSGGNVVLFSGLTLGPGIPQVQQQASPNSYFLTLVSQTAGAGWVSTAAHAGVPFEITGANLYSSSIQAPGSTVAAYPPASSFGVTLSTDLLFSVSGSTTPGPITVTNGASNIAGAISPGEIVVLYGSGLGPNSLVQATVGSNGLFPNQLAGTSIQVNGIPAPMIYAWASQAAAVVPYAVTGTTAQIKVNYQGQTIATASVPIALSAPGVFSLDATGTGQAAAINQDGVTLNSAANPTKIGDVISVYATGEGQTSPTGVDGKPATIPPPQPNLPVNVIIGGQTVKPQYAGGAPGEIAGLMQINVQIPSGIQTGNSVPIVVQVGGISSQPGVTVAVH